MSRRGKILCATDLSEAADEAIRRADEWARLYEAELIVFHAIASPLRGHPLLPQRQEPKYTELPTIQGQALDALARRVAVVTARENTEFSVDIFDENPYATILQRAEELAVDLVVVGSHGSSGLTRLPLGSVAERVVRYAHCPVLVARPGERNGRILVGTDFSDPSLPAVAAAAEQARRRDGSLTILHSLDLRPSLLAWGAGGAGVFVPPPTLPELDRGALERVAHERLNDALRRFDAPGEPVVSADAPALALVRLAEQLPAELVVVGTQGRTGLRRVLLGSVAEAVVRAAPCPVLVVRLHPS